MEAFVDIAVAWPTAFYSVLLIVVIGYWAIGLLGMADLDGDADVDLDADVDADLDADVDGGSSGGLDLWGALGLSQVPVTVSFTAIVLFAWLACFLGAAYVQPLLPLPSVVSSLLLLVAAALVALPPAAGLARPLGRLVQTRRARGNASLIGSVCVVRTGRVDRGFGQAELEDGGAGLLVDVRCDADANVSRGDRALIVSYDSETGAFEVEPMERLLAKGD